MYAHPHRRWNPLTGEAVLVSPQRAGRPWQGQIESVSAPALPVHDPACYLCPGSLRAAGQRNPAYTGPFVFDNDFPALMPTVPPAAPSRSSRLFVAEPAPGVCRVVCFTPRHDSSLALMDEPDIAAVIDTWSTETTALGARDDIHWVQIFENKGAAMGCSNPHPHGQIWASAHLPTEAVKETDRQAAYLALHGRPLLADVLAEEIADGRRLVVENDGFVVVVPFWAVWPFETLIMPRRPVASLPELSAAERVQLASVLKRLMTRYDNLFETSFPYSLGVHQAPTDGGTHPEWTLHLHVYPPLLRGATVRKFMVGYEMLAMPGRDTTPEDAAARLRGLSEVHYLSRG